MPDHHAFNVRAVAAAIAFVLNGREGAWILERPKDDDQNVDNRATLRNGEASLLLIRHYGDRRLGVSGNFPYGYQQSHDAFSITVDPTREAAQIARDIERRILTTYLPKLVEVLATKAENEAKKTATRAVVRQLATALHCHDPTRTDGSPRSQPPDPSKTSESWVLYPGDPIYKVSLDSYNVDRITFHELRCTRDQALKLIAFLAKTRPRAKKKSPGRSTTGR